MVLALKQNTSVRYSLVRNSYAKLSHQKSKDQEIKKRSSYLKIAWEMGAFICKHLISQSHSASQNEWKKCQNQGLYNITFKHLFGGSNDTHTIRLLLHSRSLWCAGRFFWCDVERRRTKSGETKAVVVAGGVFQSPAQGLGETLRGAEVRHETRPPTTRCHVRPHRRSGE